jgi:hypothetical protein
MLFGLLLDLTRRLILEIKSEVDSELREPLAGRKPEGAAVLARLRNRLAKATADASETRSRAQQTATAA